MIIIYKPAEGGTVDPIVILDYTRSDDQYSQSQIMTHVNSLGYLATGGKTINQIPRVYSLDYSLTFRHSAISYGDALKTYFSAMISNAPMELIGLLNIKQYISSENINAIKTSLSTIIDPQVFFATGAFVIKRNSNVNDVIHRTFMLYSTPFNFDSRRVNSSLTLKGASFDDMVIRLQFAVDLKKTVPIVSQLRTIFTKQGFTVTSDPSLDSLYPIERYYPPSPINNILSEVCRDNNISFDIDTDKKQINLVSLSPNDYPGSIVPETRLTFANYVPGSYLISTFALQDYASCVFESEAFDIDLFDSISIYDDSFSEGLFDNLRVMPATITAGKSILKGYRFNVLEYIYTDNREKTSITVRGTNNWIISNFKLDSFLENKIYGVAQ